MKVKDLAAKALYALRRDADAGRVEEMLGISDALTDRFVRHFNTVLDEITGEYCRNADVKDWYEFYEEVPTISGITARVLIFGMLAEYCIVEGLDEAVMWDKRYKDALAMAVRKSGSVKRRTFL